MKYDKSRDRVAKSTLAVLLPVPIARYTRAHYLRRLFHASYRSGSTCLVINIPMTERTAWTIEAEQKRNKMV